VFTFDGYGFPIAHRLQQDGQDVLVGQVEDASEVLASLEKNVEAEDETSRRRRLSLFDGLIDKMPARKLLEKLSAAKDRSEWFVFMDLNHLFRYGEELAGRG